MNQSKTFPDVSFTIGQEVFSFLGDFRILKKPPIKKLYLVLSLVFILVIRQLTTLVSDVPFLEVFLETSCAVHPCSVVLLRVRLQAAAKLITHMSIMFIHTPSPSQHPLQSLPSPPLARQYSRTLASLALPAICHVYLPSISLDPEPAAGSRLFSRRRTLYDHLVIFCSCMNS